MIIVVNALNTLKNKNNNINFTTHHHLTIKANAINKINEQKFIISVKYKYKYKYKFIIYI